MADRDRPAGGPAHRSGVVAILGRPNAGKSTLLNRVLGEKLAIVTAKPQTTRSRILGIWSRPGAQVMFFDTPGFHDSTKPLNQALNAQVAEVAGDCDVALLLVDPVRGVDDGHLELAERLRARNVPVLAIATQSDRRGRKDAEWPDPRLADLPALRTSARTGEGVAELLDWVVEHLPAGPAFYPEDDLTDRSLRFLVAELVREAAFESLDQELPYSIAVEIRSFDESRPDLVRIAADLLVERASQKGIVLGKGGAMIKRIGVAARPRIEKLLEKRIFLELWVKHDPDWPRRAKHLKSLGYC
jgi:GTP-binding protein Era